MPDINKIVKLTHVVLKPDMVLSICTKSSSTWWLFCHCIVSLLQLWMLYATIQHKSYHTRVHRC